MKKGNGFAGKGERIRDRILHLFPLTFNPSPARSALLLASSTAAAEAASRTARTR